MNAVIYARYSPGSKQTEQSIEGQLRVCQQFCKQQGYIVTETYIDRFLSASHDIEKREDFQHMIRDAEKHQFEFIVVYSLDRFARNRYDSATYKARLKKHNVRVVSATESISDSPEGVLLESVLEGMAEFFSKELAQKVTRGMYQSALKAQSTGGTVPLGYRIINKKLEIDPLYAPIVKEAFSLYAQGCSIKQICRVFNERGLTTRKGLPYTHNSFKIMFQNKKYVGTYVYNKEVEIADSVPPIIDLDTFERVQKRLALNQKAPARGKAVVNYMLSLKLFCGQCEKAMIGESANKKGVRYHYYTCGERKRHHTCTKKNVRKDPLERFVAETTLELLTPENINLIADTAITALNKEEQKNDTISNLQRDLASVSTSIDNLLRTLEMGAVSSALAARLTDLEKQRKDLQAQILDEKKSYPPLEKEHIVFWLTRFSGGNIDDPVFQRQLIDLLVNSVFLYDEPDGGQRVVIAYNLTSGSSRTLTSSDIKAFGTPLGTRTLDTLIKSQVLYQLS